MALVFGVLRRFVERLLVGPEALRLVSAKSALAPAPVGVGDMVGRSCRRDALLRVALRGNVAELVAVHRVLADLRASSIAFMLPMPLAAHACRPVALTVGGCAVHAGLGPFVEICRLCIVPRCNMLFRHAIIPARTPADVAGRFDMVRFVRFESTAVYRLAIFADIRACVPFDKPMLAIALAAAFRIVLPLMQ